MPGFPQWPAMNEKYLPAGTDKSMYNVTFSNGQCFKLDPMTKESKVCEPKMQIWSELIEGVHDWCTKTDKAKLSST